MRRATGAERTTRDIAHLQLAHIQQRLCRLVLSFADHPAALSKLQVEYALHVVRAGGSRHRDVRLVNQVLFELCAAHDEEARAPRGSRPGVGHAVSPPLGLRRCELARNHVCLRHIEQHSAVTRADDVRADACQHFFVRGVRRAPARRTTISQQHLLCLRGTTSGSAIALELSQGCN